MYKKVLISSILLWLITVLLTLIFTNAFTFLNYINTLFISSILITTVTLILFIIDSRFFVSFIKSFKYFFHKINKERQMADSIEGKQPSDMKGAITLPNYQTLLLCGISNTLLSIIISLTMW